MVFGFGKKKKEQKEGVVDAGSELKERDKKEEINIKEKVDKGYVHARVILEMLGAPKEHIEQTLHDYIEDIKYAKEIGLTDIYIPEWLKDMSLDKIRLNLTLNTVLAYRHYHHLKYNGGK